MKYFNFYILLLMIIISAGTSIAETGSIHARLESKETIKRVWAIQRQAASITTSKEKEHDIGMYSQSYEGKIVEGKIIIENVPVPGLYDLKLETKTGGILLGWDPNVPESDYVGDPPLEEESRKKIIAKLSNEDFSAFSDHMWILDMQGNIQNASLLVMKLRTRPFVGGDYKPGEWVWRVERWQWENPDEQTWVPYRKRPFYALIRERLTRKNLYEKHILFARHLGGIRLTKEKDTVDLGTVKIPQPVSGAFAINPDGSFIPPVVLKGPAKPDWPVMPKEILPETNQAGGAK